MKPTGTRLLLSIGLVTAAPAVDPASGIISQEIAAKIREGLPAYTPPEPNPEGENPDPTPQTTDRNVLILPKLTVKGKALPSDAADHLMSKRDFKRKMENLYLDTLAEDGSLNVLLNRFTIPILSPSKADRGRAIYRSRELDRLNHVNEASRLISPVTAKKYPQELDNTHTTRPAGGRQR